MKSIFRQREIEEIYDINRHTILEEIINGSIRGFDYYLNYSGKKNILSDKIIGTYELPEPILETGEEFYLHDLKELVKIDKVVRCSDGSIIYYLEDKFVETDNSKRTFDECQKKITQFNELKDRIKELEKQLAHTKRLNWWFNI